MTCGDFGRTSLLVRNPDESGRVWVFPPKGKGSVTTAVSRNAYAKFVRRACDLAGVDRWHPHQLRHNRATFGIPVDVDPVERVEGGYRLAMPRRDADSEAA